MPVVRGGREVRRKGGPDSLNAVRAGLDQWVSRESGLGGLPAPGGAPCREYGVLNGESELKGMFAGLEQNEGQSSK